MHVGRTIWIGLLNLVSAELHARQVVALDTDLYAYRKSRQRPRMYRCGKVCQAVPVRRHLQHAWPYAEGSDRRVHSDAPHMQW